MYKVIHFFTDLKDNSHPYNVGDIFPREGLNVTPQRYAELSSKFNLQGKPLIEVVDDTVSEKGKEEQKKYSKSDILRMSLDALRELATEVGIENASERTGKDLKQKLIEYYGLK